MRGSTAQEALQEGRKKGVEDCGCEDAFDGAGGVVSAAGELADFVEAGGEDAE